MDALFKGWIFLLALVTLSACTKPAKIVIPFHKPKLVIHGTLVPDSLAIIYVSQSKQSSDSSGFVFPEDAEVAIYEDEVKMADLFYKSDEFGFESPYYTNLSFRPEAGKTYTLKAKVDKLKAVEAKTAVPTSFTTDINSSAFYSSESGGRGIKVRGEVLLPPSTQDEEFYHITVLSRSRYVDVFDGDTTEIVDLKMYPTSVEPLINSSSYESYLYSGFMISTKMFKGNKVDFNADYVIYSNSQVKELSPRLYIDVRRVTKDYFLFNKAIYKQDLLSSDATSEPVVIPSNIVNGIGSFDSYSHYIKEIKY